MLNSSSIFFFFNNPATTEIYTLSLHDALPIWADAERGVPGGETTVTTGSTCGDAALQRGAATINVRRLLEMMTRLVLKRSEEHTSELQSRGHLVCRLLLEKKKQQT